MAKSFDGLYPQVMAFENLFLAFRKAARGKRGQSEVAAFEYSLEDNLLELQAELQGEVYQPGAYRSFYIRDPKRRLISAAPFRDRVVHHALVNVIEPLFERAFIGDSYANRVGRGTHKAIKRAQQFSRRYRYVLQCDLKQFFPSIDHAVLLDVLGRKLACAPTLRLCRLILESGTGVLQEEYAMVYFADDDLWAAARPRGLPIGNLTSQFWANVLLNELDQFVKRELRAPAYVRYVDDFLLFGDDKARLWEGKAAIREKLAQLRLTMHERRSTVYPVANGIPFLGFRIYPSHTRIKRRNAVMFNRRLHIHWRAYQSGRLGRDDFQARLLGWLAHAAHGDTWGLRRSLLAGLGN